VLGIVAIGKDAVPVLLDALAGKDTELASFSKAQAEGNGGNAKAYVAAAAWALGEVGRGEARDPLVRALKAADNDANRAAVARALTMLPASPDAEKAFESAYEKLAAGAKLALSTEAARPLLLDAAAGFFDPEIVPWLLKQVKAAKGPDAEDVRAAGLRAALALMKGSQASAVAAVVDKLGTDAAKESFRAGSQLVESCDVAVDCYEDKLVGSPSAGVGTKASYMLGELGDPKMAERLVHRFSEIQSNGARPATLAAIDHLAKEGGVGFADALEKQGKDGQPLEPRVAVRRTILRLRAR
jgi:HEAT repeat protein